jgi:hypothetical protein
MDNKEILSKIYINGSLHHDVLQTTFFKKRNIENVYQAILDNTSFLNDYDPSLRERIYYIEHDYNDVQRCPYCNTNKLKFNGKYNPFSKTCLQKECVTKHRNIVAIEKWSRSTKRIQYMEDICNGCGTTYKKAKNSIKRYCTQKCWTLNGDYVHSEVTKQKIRNTNSVVHSSIEFKEKHKQTYLNARHKQSETMKRKIANGEFTPCITNSWTRWKAQLNINGTIKKFRSMWEAAFYSLNTHLQYEVTRIPYIIDNNSHTYIVDFTDNTNKILYEIKPKSLVEHPRNIVKQTAAQNWCKNMGYSYVVIDDDWYISNFDRFDLTKHPELTTVINSICKKK